MWGKPFNPTSFDRLVYAFPLPWTQRSSTAAEGIAREERSTFRDCDCCAQVAGGGGDASRAREAQSRGTTTATQPLAGVIRLSLGGVPSDDPDFYAIELVLTSHPNPSTH
jgi:hypothetical protein